MNINEVNFPTGYWIWNEQRKGLQFVFLQVGGETKEERKRRISAEKAIFSTGPTRGNLLLKFKDTLNLTEQIEFRRMRQKSVIAEHYECVTLRDVKDLVLYQVIDKLSDRFIEMMFTEEVDRYLRALLIYFQYFLHIVEMLEARQELLKTKVKQMASLQKEEELRQNVSDLRAMVGREYANLLMGLGGMKNYHHMSNKSHKTMGQGGIRRFESLYQIATRIVWIALERKNFNVIDWEFNRLFRTLQFHLRKEINYSKTAVSFSDKTVLFSDTKGSGCSLVELSPATLEILSYTRDARLLAIGLDDIHPTSHRHRQLEKMFVSCECTFLENGVQLGILGRPKRAFDAMLNPLANTAEERSSERSSFKRVSSMDQQQRLAQKKAKELEIPPHDPFFAETQRNTRAQFYDSPDSREDGRAIWKMHNALKKKNAKN